MNFKGIRKGQTALITGASSGLGNEFSKQLAKRGVNLLLVSRNFERLQEIEKELNNTNVKVYILKCDLSDINDINQLLNYVEEKNFKVDILINNAGKGIHKTFDEIESEIHQNIINLNNLAPVMLTSFIIDRMLGQKQGIILNIASTMSFRPSPKWSVYGASKSFLYSFIRSLQFEYSNTNILISVLCPGKIDTNFDVNSGYDGTKSKTSPEKIVLYTLKKLKHNKRIIIPGIKAKMIYYLFKYLPFFITDKIVSRLT